VVSVFPEVAMKRIALSLAALAFVGCQPAPPATQEVGPLESAWQHVELATTSPDTSSTITSPQPSLYLFLTQHYSIMFVPGSEPRERFSGDQPVLGSFEPTDAEKVAAYDSFIANSGTYELTDSTLTTRPVVGQEPERHGG
jgi:hypothetical protein